MAFVLLLALSVGAFLFMGITIANTRVPIETALPDNATGRVYSITTYYDIKNKTIERIVEANEKEHPVMLALTPAQWSLLNDAMDNALQRAEINRLTKILLGGCGGVTFLCGAVIVGLLKLRSTLQEDAAAHS